MIEIVVRNEHSGMTLTERLEDAAHVARRVAWWAERSAKYPPGWTVTMIGGRPTDAH